MSDDVHPRVPPTWADAFASLPDATGPEGGWSRLEAALDATAAPASDASIYGVRWRRGLIALAASLAIVATIPWLVRTDGTVSSTPTREPMPVARVAGPMTSDSNTAARPSPTPEIDVVAAAATTAVTEPVRVSGARRERRAAPARTAARIDSTAASASAPQASAAVSATGRAIDAAIEATPGDAANAAVDTAAALARLHAESAQLEALIALTRDDRVESATAAVLADDLDMRIGLIDAALAEPGLSASRRSALWQQRVSTLRDMAGMESTERWLAANGTPSLGALVRID